MSENTPALGSDLSDRLGVAEMAAGFYKAIWLGKRPPFVPARVRVLAVTFRDPPFLGAGVAPGEYDCDCNQWGAVSVKARDGKNMGLLPKEFEPVAWRENT